jgi:hypothetical protein
MSKFCTEFIIHNLYRICTDNQNAEILIGKLSIISVRIIKLPFLVIYVTQDGKTRFNQNHFCGTGITKNGNDRPTRFVMTAFIFISSHHLFLFIYWNFFFFKNF